MVKLENLLGHRQNPFSCFEVSAATRAPIDFATLTHCETLSVFASGANFVGSSDVENVSMLKCRNISSSKPIAAICCEPGIGTFVRFARGGLGDGPGAGGPGAGGLPHEHDVFFAAAFDARLSQSMLSTPLQLNSPAQPFAVHIVPASLQSNVTARSHLTLLSWRSREMAQLSAVGPRYVSLDVSARLRTTATSRKTSTTAAGGRDIDRVALTV